MLWRAANRPPEHGSVKQDPGEDRQNQHGNGEGQKASHRLALLSSDSMPRGATRGIAIPLPVNVSKFLSNIDRLVREDSRIVDLNDAGCSTAENSAVEHSTEQASEQTLAQPERVL